MRSTPGLLQHLAALAHLFPKGQELLITGLACWDAPAGCLVGKFNSSKLFENLICMYIFNNMYIYIYIY